MQMGGRSRIYVQAVDMSSTLSSFLFEMGNGVVGTLDSKKQTGTKLKKKELFLGRAGGVNKLDVCLPPPPFLS